MWNGRLALPCFFSQYIYSQVHIKGFPPIFSEAGKNKKEE